MEEATSFEEKGLEVQHGAVCIRGRVDGDGSGNSSGAGSNNSNYIQHNNFHNCSLGNSTTALGADQL